MGFFYFRFWASVEPYCADITNEETRLLEELLKPPEDEAEYFKVRHKKHRTCCCVIPKFTEDTVTILGVK